MYNPRSYRIEDRNVLFAFMRQYHFATLFTHRDGESFVTHLPFMLDETRGPYGTLISHMARANPHWKAFDGAAPSVVVFAGPHAYISPSWYEDQVTVPTWNYTVVHATGTPRLVTEEAALHGMVMALVEHEEAPLGHPWDVRRSDPVVPVELQGIAGFEIPIDRLEGKFKLNQNRSREDQEGVVRALETSPDPFEREIARLMRANLGGATPMDARPNAAPDAAGPATDGVFRAPDPRHVMHQRAVGGILALGAGLLLLIGVLIALVAADDLPRAWRVLLPCMALAVTAVLGWVAWAWPAVEHRHTRWRLGDGGIEIRRGVWWRREVFVPRSRVQHTDVSQGPLERAFGLATLRVFTAGTDHAEVSLGGLSFETATDVRDHLLRGGGDDVV